MNPGNAEVHLRENVHLTIDESDDFEKELSFEEMYYANLFEDSVELTESAVDKHFIALDDFLLSSVLEKILVLKN